MARILIIDDDPHIRRMIARTLSTEHHEVIEAADGYDGVKQFHAHRPDLVTTDIVMPNQEGIETITELLRDTPDVPILAISGGAGDSASYLEFARMLGAGGALAKPFRGAQLIAAVSRLHITDALTTRAIARRS